MVALPICGDMRSLSSPKGRRIVVSHRLPLRAVHNPDAPYGFDFSVDPDALPFEHSRGLAGDVVFVGTLPAAAASLPASEELAAHLLERFSCSPVFLSADLHKDFYHGFCMNYLWPLFHGETFQLRCSGGSCMIDYELRRLYDSYVVANKRFAERVFELLISPDENHVYIHDYHLLTVPTFLRKRWSPCTRIYFTLHSAFLFSDVFCSSPIAKDLLCNLLNADLLAFASSSLTFGHYASSYEGFLYTCYRLLNLSFQSRQGYITIDYLDRTVAVMSISTSSGEACHLREMLSLPETASIVREISTKYMGRKLLLDVEDDDCFYWNRCNKLLAMEKLLESQTELHGQVVLVKINNTRRHISAKVLAIRDRINSRFGHPGYEPVVVIDDPSMLELLAFYTSADVFITKTLSMKKFIDYTVCRQEGPTAHASAGAPRNGTIIAAGSCFGSTTLSLLSGKIRVNSCYDDGIAMADAMGSVLRMNEEEKQLLQDNHYSYVVSSKYDPDYGTRSFEEDLETAGRYHKLAKILAQSCGKLSPIFLNYDDMVSPQELNMATALEVFRMAKKKMSTCQGLFSWLTFEKFLLLMNNNPAYHSAGKYRSFLQDYDDMVLPQGLNKATTLEMIRILKVMCSDQNNTTCFVTGGRKDKPAIWLALHKLIADHGYFTSTQSKKATFSVRIPSYLGQLVAACNSSASAGQSGMALLHPSRRPLIRFLLDSGASMHVVGDAGLLHHLRHLPRAAARFATLPDGSRLPIIGVGTIQMDGFSIPNVYLVEGLTVNLVSVSRLATEHGICCCFYRNRCQLMLLTNGRARVVGEAVLENDGVYGLRFLRVPETTA